MRLFEMIQFKEQTVVASALALVAVGDASAEILAFGSVALGVTQDADCLGVARVVTRESPVGNVIRRHLMENDAAVLAKVAILDECRG